MTKKLLLSFLPLFVAIGIAQEPVAQLPLSYIDTTFNPPTGATWPAHTSTDFSNALNSANPGDTIVLDAGVTYQGNFTLPAKSNSNQQWIYVVGSALSSLPVPGTRVDPSTDAANMPKIVTPNSTAALTLAPGANYYRLVGLEVYSASNYGCIPTAHPPKNCWSYFLINGHSAIGKPLVDSITVDRCYVHGSPTQDVIHAVVANGSNFAVVDSYISDVHGYQVDSQAILAYYSPGPIKIVNNLLSATGEDVMFGGAGGLRNPWVPSDIEIRNNHFYKPLSWKAVGVTIPPNNPWIVKNNLELKSGRRVIVDRNVFENNWASAQTGYSVLFTNNTHQSGLIAVVDDVTFSNNILTNVVQGIDGHPYDTACLPASGCTNRGETKRIVIVNNLLLMGDNTGPGGFNLPISFLAQGGNGNTATPGLTDWIWQHNTVIPPPGQTYCAESFFFNSFPLNAPRSQNLWVLDNVLCRQPTGNGGAQGTSGLTTYMGQPAPLDPRFYGNVMYVPTVDKVQTFPAHNYATTVPFVYVDPSSGNYQLSVPNWTDTSDGQISGVNYSNLP